MTDWHARLGVRPGADAAELRRAYRLLVHLYHPDKHRGTSGEAQACARLREVTEAYHELRRRAPRGRRGGPAGWLRFRWRGEEVALGLEGVREVAPRGTLRQLPGAGPPFGGWLELRGELLPVVVPPGRQGWRCVLILEQAGRCWGIALEDLPRLETGGEPGMTVRRVEPQELRGEETAPD
ncbi:MAG: DnaJ domain-containing protein [Thermaerobacter sp.]|nr:DnaJ domain-containing protein [Thermaerobacter sp.]